MLSVPPLAKSLIDTASRSTVQTAEVIILIEEEWGEESIYRYALWRRNCLRLYCQDGTVTEEMMGNLGEDLIFFFCWAWSVPGCTLEHS